MEPLEILLRSGRLEEAANAATKDFAASLTKASALGRLGRAREALELLSDLSTENRNDAIRVLLARIEVLQNIGRHNEISTLMTEAEVDGASDELKAEFSLRKGEFLQMFGSHEEAVDALNESLKFAEGHGLRGIALMALEACAESMRVLDALADSGDLFERAHEHAAALAQESDDPSLVLRAAESLSLNAESDDDDDEAYEEASEAYDRALKLAKEKGYKWDEAAIHLSHSRFREFLADFDKAVELTGMAIALLREMKALPSLLAATDQLASQHANSGNFEEALKALEQIIASSRILGDDFTMLNTLGKCSQMCFENEDYETGLDYLKKVIEESSSRNLKPPFVVNLLKEAYRKAGVEMVREHLGEAYGEEEEYGL